VSKTPANAVRYLLDGEVQTARGVVAVRVAQVVAHELGIDLDRVRVSTSDTARIPNASATAAAERKAAA
jgi:xanthine dehydrogenase molybdopterin-binding subunit B